MKIIFLSIGGFKSIEAHDQYPDLLREFQKNGHEIFVVCSNEKKTGKSTELEIDHGAKILRVRTGNITQSGLIEKGIATIMLGYQYKMAIKKYFRNIKFDLILYTTPPISLANVIAYLKKRNNAITYLILKDIFPQNAVDIGMLQSTGLLYHIFKKQEKKLYRNSDKIGTMSKANQKYLLVHNPEINPDKVEVCPNCIDARIIKISDNAKRKIRKKYKIPLNKKVFVYGGNLGKPQDIPFVIRCIQKANVIENAFFWVIGNGTEYTLIEKFVKEKKPKNLKLTQILPKEDYDRIIASCDVGLIFLDHRFTIPNFPSRLLSYMQAGLPVLSCTDSNSDIGQTIIDGKFGWMCKSNSEQNFVQLVQKITLIDTTPQAQNARIHLADYTANKCFNIISESISKILNGAIK